MRANLGLFIDIREREIKDWLENFLKEKCPTGFSGWQLVSTSTVAKLIILDHPDLFTKGNLNSDQWLIFIFRGEKRVMMGKPKVFIFPFGSKTADQEGKLGKILTHIKRKEKRKRI